MLVHINCQQVWQVLSGTTWRGPGIMGSQTVGSGAAPSQTLTAAGVAAGLEPFGSCRLHWLTRNTS